MTTSPSLTLPATLAGPGVTISVTGPSPVALPLIFEAPAAAGRPALKVTIKATPVAVTDGPSLLAALAIAEPGATILLGAGVYTGGPTGNSGPRYNGVTVPAKAYGGVTIQGQSGASIAGLYAKGVSELTFQDVEFSFLAYAGTPDPTGNAAKVIIPVQFQNCTDIAIDGGSVHGPAGVGLGEATSSITIAASADVTVSGVEFHDLHYGVQYFTVANLTLADNFFHDLFDDARRGGGLIGATFSGNRIQDLHSDPTDTDHPDALQIWTAPGVGPSSKVAISDEIYLRGSGAPIQGFPFSSNAAETPMVLHSDWTITDTINAGGDPNGMTIQGVDGVVASGNILQGDSRPVVTAYAPEGVVIQPKLIIDSCQNVTLTNSQAPSAPAIDPWAKPAVANAATKPTNLFLTTGLTESGNTVVAEPYTDGGAALLTAWLARSPRKFASPAL